MITVLIVVSAYAAYLASVGEHSGLCDQTLIKWAAITACLIGLILDGFT